MSYGDGRDRLALLLQGDVMSTGRVGDVSADRVAAAVVTYDRVAEIGRVVDALLRQVVAPGAIIVVDNGSSDGTAELVRARYPSVVLVRVEDNCGAAGGFAEAMRAGARLGYDWTWVFNDDDIPDRSALAQLLSALRCLPERTGMLACARRDDSGGVHSLGGRWTGRQHEVHRSAGLVAPVGVDVVAFSGTLVSTELVRDIGLPQEDFFMMMEELDFCLRARDAGWSIAVHPAPMATSRNLGSRGSSPAWRGYYQTRNHLLMVRRRRSLDEGGWWIVRTLKFLLASLVARDQKGRRIVLRLRGARDGLLGVTGRTVDDWDPQPGRR